jgi:RimJ/RimL family protein N-acetyltransferase
MMGPARGETARLDMRPIEPGDKQLLQAFRDNSSADAGYRRFFGPRGPFAAGELRYLTEVDHRDHEAIVAINPATGGLVGVARFVRDRRAPGNAEIAVIVTDAWQGHGVGSALLSRLADRARAEGVTRFTGLMLSGNRPMARLFAELGEPQVVSRDGVTVELAVEIGPTSGRP